MRNAMIVLMMLVFAVPTIGQQELKSNIVIPHVVTREYVEFGCPSEYIGVYIAIGSGWDNNGSSWFSSSDEQLRLCITKQFIADLRKAKNELAEAQKKEAAKPAKTGVVKP